MATVRWLGAAQDIQGVSTWTFANTFATNDTVTVTCNNKALILTLGTDVTTTQVAAETAAMINATSATSGLVGTPDETRNFGGREIAEFTECVASSSGAVLTIKSTAGVPVTITVEVDTAGDGSVGAETVVTAATGKNFFDNAANWEGGAVPQTDDTILLDTGSVEIKYNLNRGISPIVNLSLTKRNSYKGNVGLPAVNALGYIEYRERYLNLVGDGPGNTQWLSIGDDSLVEPEGYLYLDLGTTAGDGVQIDVNSAPVRTKSGIPLMVINGDAVTVNCRRGAISVGEDETADQATSLSALKVDGDGYVYLGKQVTFSTTAMSMTGKSRVDSDATGTAASLTMYGGEFVVGNPKAAKTITTATLRGGTLYAEGTITTCNIYAGATLAEPTGIGDSWAVTVTNCNAYEGSAIRYPFGLITFTNGIDCHGCQINDVLKASPDHLTWTPTAI